MWEERMYCFVFPSVSHALKATNFTLYTFFLDNEKDRRLFFFFLRKTSKTFQWIEVVLKMGLQPLWTSGGCWALKRKPLSNEEHSQSSQTPHLTTATSSDATTQIHTQIMIRDQAVDPCREAAHSDLALWINCTHTHFMDKLLSARQVISTLLSSAGFRSNDKDGLLSYWTPEPTGWSVKV